MWYSDNEEKPKTDSANTQAVSERMLMLLNKNFEQRNLFAELERKTGVDRNTWRQWYRRADTAEPTSRLLIAAAKLWPNYSLWLLTGMTDEIAGYVGLGMERHRTGALANHLSIVRDQTEDYLAAQEKMRNPEDKAHAHIDQISRAKANLLARVRAEQIGKLEFEEDN